MRGRFALAALLVAAPACAANEPQQPPAWPTGLYSNVQMSEQTGDLGGLEVRFYEEAGKRMAELVFCEGWCNEVHVSEVQRDGTRFTFGYSEMFTGAKGEVPVKVRFAVWPAGSSLNYEVFQADEKLDLGKPERLRRASEPFGLDVAKSGKD